ncbi:glycosyltransferase [Alkaliphilus serpentinus]|uniref:Glycosyltransferase n=1 Tax=Alkaliphilus serpentinus TaxID=1482731 RepID=A0A833M6G7_9FIRM|nr:glycosyltransferase [Alkaliphilus serpentinus]KAB3527378.1 glycosyltransferase [Alkaliphilus serpentinus]
MTLYILIITSCITCLLFVPLVEDLLTGGNVLKENYKGKLIPAGMGIIIIPVLLINTILMMIIQPNTKEGLLIFLVGSFVMGFSGIIDDIVGNHSSRGLKGHLNSLLKGKLTTGGLKAITGVLIAIIIGLFNNLSLLDMMVNTIIITLMTNLLNLFDLRPGRCLKVFLLISTITIPFGLNQTSRSVIFILVGFSIIYIRDDLKARSMLGDVGSNILGINLGIAFALSFSFYMKLFISTVLIALHLISEKTSFSKIINGNNTLNYLDELGRDKG